MNTNAKQQLIFSGILLFFFGLLQGGLIPYFTNTRMALSAHLAAVQSGMALALLGLIWPHIRLCLPWMMASRLLNIYGTYAIWAGLTLAAIWGTSRITPIAGAGHQGSPVQELTVHALVVAGSMALTVGIALVLVGLVAGKRIAGSPDDD